MPNKDLLLAGIDPGTTTAYALVDLKGNLLSSRSSKGLSLPLLLEEIHSQGKIIAVGTDKAKTPHLIEEFAAKLGARIFSPEHDLGTIEKREMAREESIHDIHEMDALASARFAYQKLAPLLIKIERFCEENKKHHLKEKIIEKVVKDGMSIWGAQRSLEEVKEVVEQKIARETPMSEKTMIKREMERDDLASQIKILKRYNSLLRRELSNSKKPTLILRKDPSKELKEKTGLIDHLRHQLTKKEQEKQHFQRKANTLQSIILGMNGKVVIKKLENLGSSEFKRKQFLRIEKDDILLVDDPSSMSMAVIDELKEKVSIIIHKKPIGERARSILPFILLDASTIPLKELDILALAKEEDIKRAKMKKRELGKIVEDYKKERQILMSP